MNRYYYDMHIHSCLSPCADNDMTPNNIAGMATIAGINILALTDHNSSKNCPAFFTAAKANGIIPIAGMELTTAEDIHVVCLFEKLDEAMLFDSIVDKRRIPIANRTDIFGNQLIMDSQDRLIGTDPNLLPNATTISIEEAFGIVTGIGGICYPAHIDRDANGIIAVLGTLPNKPEFKHAEIYDRTRIAEFKQRFPRLNEMQILCSSDAHYLWDIRDKENYFDIDDEPYSSELVRHRLFEILKGRHE